jgi:GxxExxY protein
MGRIIDLIEEVRTGEVFGAAIEVHKVLGPGLLESAYQRCLARELGLRGIVFEQEKPLPVEYKGIALDCGYRLDFLLEGSIVVELKAVEMLENIHRAQLLTYLRLTGYKVGLLINLNVPLLKNGIVRMVL